MNIKGIRYKVVKAQRNKGKEKNSVPLCLSAFVPNKKGFTLIELLVVVAIMGMLAGILLPTLSTARERGRRAVCAGNLKVIGEAFNMYNIDIGEMPPTDDAFTPNNHQATNQIGKAGAPIVPIGLGYFYDEYIEDFAVFVCPSSLSTDFRVPDILKRDWNSNNDTYSAYIYRAESGGSSLMLSDAGPAIVMDYNVKDGNYNHKGEYVNILFRNGNVKGVENKDETTRDLNPDGILTFGGDASNKDELFEDGADSYQ